MERKNINRIHGVKMFVNNLNSAMFVAEKLLCNTSIGKVTDILVSFDKKEKKYSVRLNNMKNRVNDLSEEVAMFVVGELSTKLKYKSRKVISWPDYSTSVSFKRFFAKYRELKRNAR